MDSTVHSSGPITLRALLLPIARYDDSCSRSVFAEHRTNSFPILSESGSKDSPFLFLNSSIWIPLSSVGACHRFAAVGHKFLP